MVSYFEGRTYITSIWKKLSAIRNYYFSNSVRHQMTLFFTYLIKIQWYGGIFVFLWLYTRHECRYKC